MREIKVRLRKNYGAVDILINNILICSFEKNGNFLFWGQSNGSPRFEGKWIGERETGEFKISLELSFQTMIRINLNNNPLGLAFIHNNGEFNYYGEGAYYRGKWNE